MLKPDNSCLNPRLAIRRKNDGIVSYFEFFFTNQRNGEKASLTKFGLL
ncbi:hypothetical protein PEDI_34170 [Persicobacter diffluens]|uniref:Uncharacterized protein n=1 Tax=Persicobacter diffluens TaxID=981 RepID=A0AAN4W1M9_9BACT|nr:hypothetical protein PEDI_34170 [Persicobacter diffluens]